MEIAEPDFSGQKFLRCGSGIVNKPYYFAGAFRECRHFSI
jgi:hypothetical protein